MKILVTGSTGFLGKEVCSMLKLENKSIYKISSKKKRGYVKCNLKNHKKIKKILEEIRPDIIINMAATIDFKKKNIEEFKLNFKLPEILANYCLKYKKFLVQVSTVYVHGEKKKYSIKSKFDNSTTYGYSKLKGDMKILKSNCNHSIIRFPGIFGKNGPDHLYINKVLKERVKKKLITLHDSGNQKRNYIFVKDAAKFVYDCVKKQLKGIFYVCGETLSVKTMLNNIKKNYNFKIIHLNNKKAKHDQIIIPNYKINYTKFKIAIKNL
jgi:dTDP-4-dehydrorhamnose reductase|tara:strand:+ start:149 stop:949 length:801 start_codon:yes stop_codon:yes gene_type:complete